MTYVEQRLNSDSGGREWYIGRDNRLGQHFNRRNSYTSDFAHIFVQGTNHFCNESHSYSAIHETDFVQIHWLFSLLSVKHIYITERGALRGVVALKEVGVNN